MTVTFPSNPANNATYSFGNRTWLWTNTNGGFWQAISTTVGYTGSQGDTGYTGSQGDTGYTGSFGLPGYTGSNGNNFSNGQAIAVSSLTVNSTSFIAANLNSYNATFNIPVYYTANVSLGLNNTIMSFTPLAGGSNVYFTQQGDDNFVFYSTNTTNQARAIWSVYANSITSNIIFSVPVNITTDLGVTGSVNVVGSYSQNNVIGGIIPSGGIIMWSGNTSNIPVGWNLCDGTNGTPDLRDRFVVGAGNTYLTSNTGGRADAIVVSHTHTATSSVTDTGHSHWISGASYDDGNFSGYGNNTQDWGLYADASPYSNTDPQHSFGRYSNSALTYISVNTAVDFIGSSGTNANLPPYYALCFIMKL